MTEPYAHGLVLGKFYPPHAGHAHLIRTAQRACRQVTVLVLASRAESIPLAVRADWLAEDHPRATIVAAYDDLPVDFTSDAAWTQHLDLIRPLLPAPVDAVFTGDGYGAELARRLDAVWVRVDRQQNPVSSTAVRADPERWWPELSPCGPRLADPADRRARRRVDRLHHPGPRAGGVSSAPAGCPSTAGSTAPYARAA